MTVFLQQSHQELFKSKHATKIRIIILKVYFKVFSWTVQKGLRHGSKLHNEKEPLRVFG